MTEEELKKAIEDPRNPIYTQAGLATIEKKEYPFFKNYVNPATTSEEVREDLLVILNTINQSWCYKYYLQFLKDPSSSVRISAASGMARLDSGVHADELMAEISRQNSLHQEDRTSVVGNLILAVGNSRDPKYLEPVLALRENESDPDIRYAYYKAAAKLGYQKFLREIERNLKFDDGQGKDSALGIVFYLKDPVWIDKIKPLLLDEDSSLSYPLGRKTILFRVCDATVNVLHEIDPEKKIPFEPRSRHYLPDELKEIRKIYGVLENPK